MKPIRYFAGVLVGISILYSIAFAWPFTPDDPWDGLLETNEPVTYTQEDAERYLTYYEQSFEHADYYQLITLEQWQEQYMRSPEADPYMHCSLPLDIDISKADAICTAYAWLEQQSYLTDDDFSHYIVAMKFFANDHDTSTRLWFLDFHPIEEERMAQEGDFLVYIDSQTGNIVYTGGSFRAVG